MRLAGPLIAVAALVGCAPGAGDAANRPDGPGETAPAAPAGSESAPAGETSVDPESGPWVEAQVQGARFRAIGQEPGWHVEVFPERTTVVADYGEIEFALPPPSLERDAEGRVRTLTWETEAHAVTIGIERTVCADPMSGFESPLTIRMTMDGRTLQGCGRELGPAFLGDWRIVRLGPASPSPAEGDDAPRIRFGAWTTAAGTTGCNRMSGEWTSAEAGDVRLGPMATTRRACPPDLMDQESRVLESLAAVRGYRTTGDTLFLLGPDDDALLTGVREGG